MSRRNGWKPPKHEHAAPAPARLRWYIVVGRVPEDETQVGVYHAITSASAEAAFKRDLYPNLKRPPAASADNAPIMLATVLCHGDRAPAVL